MAAGDTTVDSTARGLGTSEKSEDVKQMRRLFIFLIIACTQIGCVNWRLGWFSRPVQFDENSTDLNGFAQEMVEDAVADYHESDYFKGSPILVLGAIVPPGFDENISAQVKERVAATREALIAHGLSANRVRAGTVWFPTCPKVGNCDATRIVMIFLGPVPPGWPITPPGMAAPRLVAPSHGLE